MTSLHRESTDSLISLSGIVSAYPLVSCSVDLRVPVGTNVLAGWESYGVHRRAQAREVIVFRQQSKGDEGNLNIAIVHDRHQQLKCMKYNRPRSLCRHCKLLAKEATS